MIFTPDPPYGGCEKGCMFGEDVSVMISLQFAQTCRSQFDGCFHSNTDYGASQYLDVIGAADTNDPVLLNARSLSAPTPFLL